jgi:predicted  nucleic acid-binding Zn-ribbon protein
MKVPFVRRKKHEEALESLNWDIQKQERLRVEAETGAKQWHAIYAARSNEIGKLQSQLRWVENQLFEMEQSIQLGE